ncbi:phospholipase D family protein [Gemmobacter lutimaris]|uniref:Phospholipase D n=1 Tax=Gemmobacter lutimaris TaxID=2306023 RepID=A0A398BRD3_9RHOB|nr:phospholipase D family protein [Gemmobacter lutimaris]RID92087.1 phospholipase D family protein [Gemmobacter lutimaris]
MGFLRFVLKLALVCVALIILARFLFPLPSLESRIPSQALPAAPETPLSRALQPEAGAHPGLTGIRPLHHGAEAYAARMLLARAATRSIDARYYIWQRDLTGLPLLDELRAAAERGVRVRLLVDDNGTSDLDTELAALNALPSAEVRIFNPFTLRKPRMLSYAFDFPRLNRRMHNKSFTVDGAATIIGGRNIGDIYFSRAADTQFADFDLLATGAILPEVDADFDAYWNSGSAYPHELLMKPVATDAARFAAAVAEAHAAPDSGRYDAALRDTRLVADLLAGKRIFEWVPVQLVSDDPAKGLGPVAPEALMLGRLAAIVGTAEQRLDLVSAYFVPGKRGVEVLTGLAARGVKVRTLTNSLEATDVLPVHASYVKYRKALLEGGVEVYELKRSPASAESAERLGLLGSSGASLHAKTFALDDNRIFVGSFNFDPRSVLLNCEMGFLIQSPGLATAMRESFDSHLGETSWRVTEAPDGLVWSDGSGVPRTDEPGTSLFHRIALTVIGFLPVEWMM